MSENGFRANPEIITREGNKIIDSSVSFKENTDKIMDDVRRIKSFSRTYKVI